MSSKDVAEGAGVGPSALSRIESGEQEPIASTMIRILDAMDADLSDLQSAMKGGEML
jgi:transcriptional regulator with XRE-family HTH domain